MCGIVGMINFSGAKNFIDKKNFFIQALYADAMRGAHATGMFMVPTKENEEIEIYKKALAAADFICLPKAEKLFNKLDDYKFIVGHNRHATTGKHINSNAHPFQIEHITLVHNGTLFSQMDVYKDFHKYDVDSEVLTAGIATDGYQKIIPKIKTGAAALVWHDAKDKALRLYRNKERPLFFGKVNNEEILLFASEYYMLKWIAIRNGLNVPRIFDVGEDNIITFTDSVSAKDVEKIKPESPVVYSYPARFSSGSKGGATEDAKKPKKFNGKTISELMNDYNIKPGDKIQFTLMKKIKARKNSRHVALYGLMVVDPFLEVVAFNIEENKFNGVYILEGEVSSLVSRKELHEDDYAILLTKITETKDVDWSNYNNFTEEQKRKVNEGTTEEIPKKLPVLSGISNETARAIHLSSGSPGGEKFADIPTVRGPNNTVISINLFKKLTQDGCADCSGNIDLKQADFIEWTPDRQPICPECTNKQHMINRFVQ